MDVATDPWVGYEPRAFRLAGYGGAALLLRATIMPGAQDAPEAAVLGFDVGFVTPGSDRRALARPAGPRAVQRLSALFFAVANAARPEDEVEPFDDPVLGLRVAAVSSSDTDVEVEAALLADADGFDGEPDGVAFLTARTALATAAVEVRGLTGAGPDDAWDEGAL